MEFNGGSKASTTKSYKTFNIKIDYHKKYEEFWVHSYICRGFRPLATLNALSVVENPGLNFSLLLQTVMDDGSNDISGFVTTTMAVKEDAPIWRICVSAELDDSCGKSNSEFVLRSIHDRCVSWFLKREILARVKQRDWKKSMASSVIPQVNVTIYNTSYVQQ